MSKDIDHFASSEYRKEIVVSLKRWLRQQIANGWNGYFLNFMFHQLSGNQAAVKCQMKDEVERFYAKIITRIIRNPRSSMASGKLPIFIGCPDLPVWKHEKVSLSKVTINDGLHFNGIFLLPAISRLKTGFRTHMHEHKRFYADGKRGLRRIQVERIRQAPGYVADYALKALKHGRISYDDLLILPKHSSEL
jgi:hypothetical protein